MLIFEQEVLKEIQIRSWTNFLHISMGSKTVKTFIKYNLIIFQTNKKQKTKTQKKFFKKNTNLEKITKFKTKLQTYIETKTLQKIFDKISHKIIIPIIIIIIRDEAENEDFRQYT